MYDLTCVTCEFETTEDSISETLDIVEEHREEHGHPHFVEFERQSE